MPITRIITLYRFDELSEEAQEAALSNLHDVNVHHNWRDSMYEDAKLIGLEIKEFDIERRTIKGELNEYLLDVCKSIRKNHGKGCRTFQAATAYHKQYIAAFIEWYGIQTQQVDPSASHWKPKDWLANFKLEDEAQEIEADFAKKLLEDYLLIWRNEYEYQTSREQVVETIKANDYLFTKLGKLA
jgi:hypothetical protein